MYDINTKNVKKGKNIYYLFIAIGVVFLAILSVIVLVNVKKKNSMDSDILSYKVEVNSYEDSESGTMYRPVYYYRVNGVEYSCSAQSGSNVYPSLDNKTVYYDSSDPRNCITEKTMSDNKIIILIGILPLLFIVIGIINIIKISKRLKLIEELNQRGKLVKGLPYRLEDTNVEVNGVRIQRPVVDYMLPSGSMIILKGDPRNDKKIADQDGLVDIVIDENDPNNYYIDFEINRLTGNTSSDYYKGPTNINNNMNDINNPNNNMQM